MSESPFQQIEHIRRAVSDNENRYARGRGAERNTQGHLVKPLLHSMGWPPTSIRTEYPVVMEDVSGNYVEGFIDLALFQGDRVVLAVEVKKLGSDVGEGSDAQRALKQYLISSDCSSGLTTDGAVWTLWKRSGVVMDSIWSVNLLRQDIEESIKTMEDINFDNIMDLKGRVELREVRTSTLESTWTELLGNRNHQIDRLAEILKEEVNGVDEGLGIKATDAKKYLNSLYEGVPALILTPGDTGSGAGTTQLPVGTTQSVTRRPPPRSLIIEGQRTMITEVYEILTKTVEWLLDHGLLNIDDCPIKLTSGSRSFRYHVNTEPLHENGTPFLARKEVRGFFVETHYNRQQAEYYARKLLHRFRPGGTLQVES